MTFSSEIESDYWTDTQRPLASLVFLLPLLIGYETAVVVLGGGTAAAGLRNGADTWMRGWLLQSGIQFPWVLPLAVSGGLLGWHLVRREPWECRTHTLLGMLAESLLFALILIICGQTLHMAFRQPPTTAAICAGAGLSVAQIRTVSYLGAGLYEESLFRLLLLPALYGIVRALRGPRGVAGLFAVILSSLVFAAAHYLPNEGSALSPASYAAAFETVAHNAAHWYSFAFRAMAGAAFGTLFVLRGFGVTVGSHALYDILVGFMASLAT